MEELPINLSFDFVTDPSKSSLVTQTGDPMTILLIALATLVCCGVGLLLYRKRMIARNILKASATTSSMLQHFNQRIIDSGKFVKIIVGLIVAFLIVMIFGIVGVQQSYAANPEQRLVPDSNKIIATVSDDGQISLSDCNLLNVSKTNYTLASSSVSLSEEVKNIKALENTKICIGGFGGIVYDDVANGTVHEIAGLSALPAGESTKLSFSLENLDNKTALSLCGKSVFQINLMPVKANGYTHAIALNDEGATTSGTHLIYEHYYDGWYSDQDCTTPITSITPPSKTYYEFQGYKYEGLEIIDKTGNIVADPIVFDNDTQLNASWKYTVHHDSLDAYSWEELKAVAEDLSLYQSSSDYYTEFDNYAKNGATKQINLSNSDILHVRIIGICHDDKSDGTGKAGLTFMGQNSLNKGYYTGDKGSPESSYACGWAGDGKKTTSSPLRDKMQLGGEIYNLIQPGLGITPTQVKKSSKGGWTGAAEELYVADIRVSDDYFFLPSGIELGTKRFGEDEGTEYEYNKNDALPERWRFSDVCSAGILVNLNHTGYTWLMENKDNYSTSDSAWNAVPENGKVPCDGPRACWERSVANGSILRVTEWDLVGNLHYQGVPFGDYWGGITQTACICPCFCL